MGGKDPDKQGQKVDAKAEARAEKAKTWRYPANPFFLKRIFFLDVDPLVSLGYRTRLEPEHMFPDAGLRTKTLIDSLEPAWQEELKKPQPDLKRALLRGNVGSLVYTGVLYGVSQACSLAGPLLLRRIVSGLQCQSIQRKVPMDMHCPANTQLYYYIIGLFAAPAIQSMCENHQMFGLYRLGTRMRNSLMAAIYRKCLRLSNAALQAESTGKVVTLMSNDAQKLQDAMFAIHAMWGSPCYIVAVLVLLWFEVGWATFVGLGVMLALVPATGMLAARLGMLRRSIMQWTDQRVGRMNEVINGIQMIKFYAWEESFRAAVMECRSQEASILRRMALWQGVFGLLLFYGPVAVALFTFGSFAIAGRSLSPAEAYTALALFSLLRFPMSFLPMLVTMVVNALIAIKRIGGFLQREEAALHPWDPATTPAGTVTLDGASFAWDTAAPRPTLRDVTLAAAPGSLTMVVGGVGSGKSSLLSALIGTIARVPTRPESVYEAAEAARAAAAEAKAAEAEAAAAAEAAAGAKEGKAGGVAKGDKGKKGKESAKKAAGQGEEKAGKEEGTKEGKEVEGLLGRVAVGGRIAYVAQSAWIMNDTLQENVLMGAPLDPERYRAALEAAQLGPDLAILPAGDLTEIGDRGITLSGGQKQRVAIARALYADADVYLLDDPLSAVDSHVGRALFEQVIRGALRSKTVVLVTNALQYLPHADCVLWMEGGGVRAAGAYGQLVEAGLNIEELCHDEEEDRAEGEAAAASEAATLAKEGLDAGAAAEEAAEADPLRTDSSGSGSGASGSDALPSAVAIATPIPTPAALEEDGAAKAGKVAAAPGKEGGAKGGKGTIAEGKITLTRRDVDSDRNLTGIETREAGAISGSVIGTYFFAGGGWIFLLILLALFGLEQFARVYTDMWVGNWFGDKFDRGQGFYLGLYFLLGVVYGATTFVRSTTFLFFCVRASLSIHNQLLNHILALPKSFFDTNPAGRILNRFSRDTDIMDSTLSGSLIQFAGSVVSYIAILVVITIATPWFGVALLPLTVIYFSVQRYYIPAARELQRIESISRSPIYSRFAEALAGVATLRAYRLEAHFTAHSDTLMERNAHAFVTQKLAAAWLGMRLDMLGLAVLTLSGALCIQGGIDPGMAGLALVYALDLTRFLKHGTNMASKSEADFNSVERIAQYLTPETEARPDTPPEVAAALPADWPPAGAISVQQLCMRYRPGMPLVLQGVSFEVAAGEKVGLVGRTGSGKSSLLLALFRMVEADSGRILIDGVDIASLGVRHLRSKMSIIPQDPFMFSGTVRRNLDPFDGAQDEELWRVLESVGLREPIRALEGGLAAKVVDGGANFSLGQRQLFCLARAMLRRSRILMLDEATASVDVDTDSAIQAALRERFVACTCLTIAHRLHTVADVDRVVVLAGGRLVEQGPPDELLEKPEGLFSGMVNQTGRNAARQLRALARNAASIRAAGGSGMGGLGSGGTTPMAGGGAPTYERARSVFGSAASFAARGLATSASGGALSSMAGDSAYTSTYAGAPHRAATADLTSVAEAGEVPAAPAAEAAGNGGEGVGKAGAAEPLPELKVRLARSPSEEEAAEEEEETTSGSGGAAGAGAPQAGAP